MKKSAGAERGAGGPGAGTERKVGITEIGRTVGVEILQLTLRQHVLESSRRLTVVR